MTDATRLLEEAIEFYQGIAPARLSNAALVVRQPDASPEQIRDEAESSVRLIRISRLVYGEEREKLEEMLNISAALSTTGCTVLMLLLGKPTGVTLAVGVHVAPGQAGGADLREGQLALKRSLLGQFPGSVLEEVDSDGVAALMSDKSSFWRSVRAIASIQGIPAVRTETGQAFVQNIDRFIDAMRGEEYAVLAVAEPITADDLAVAYRGHAELHTALSPLAEQQLQISTAESKQTSVSVQNSLAKSVARSVSRSRSTSVAKTKSTADTVGGGVSSTTSANASFTPFGIGGGVSESVTVSANYSRTWSRGTTESRGEAEIKGTVHGEVAGVAVNEGVTEGQTTTEGASFSVKNRLVQHVQERIDQNLARLEEGMQYGFWRTGIYVAATDAVHAQVGAGILQGLFRGEGSAAAPSEVSVWDSSTSKEHFTLARRALQRFAHPQIKPDAVLTREFVESTDVQALTPTTMLNGKELGLVLSLPEWSAPGLTVARYARFGRQVDRLDRPRTVEDTSGGLDLGTVFHMGSAEEERVELDRASLARHTLVCGATGSGKTNTTVNMLRQLSEGSPALNYLVVEPVKDEYRQLAGLPKHARPRYLTSGEPGTEWLRINPFRFAEGIHVYTHVERVAQVFNAAFPMYASMPALLEEAIRRAYQRAGWDLSSSRCHFTPTRFPTLHDLLEELDGAVEEVGYSPQLAADFRGALGARIRSLTRGIRGDLLCPLPGDETPDEVLFSENCVVNLRAIGAPDTKALIMGLLLTRLYERRQQEFADPQVRDAVAREKVRHVTVIEEAHTLLRRTNTEVSMEGSNLRGLAVEMFADAIAEMRALGQGFVVVDQSPVLLDPSAIKNTNTKILHRLPSADDRATVGAAINAREPQWDELGRLPTGVAAVFQNDWLEPVLCKVRLEELSRPTKADVVEDPAMTREQMLLLVSLPRTAVTPEGVDRRLKSCLGLGIDEALEQLAARVGDAGAVDSLRKLHVPETMDEGYQELHQRWGLVHVDGIAFASEVTAYFAHLLGFSPGSEVVDHLEEILRGDAAAVEHLNWHFFGG